MFEAVESLAFVEEEDDDDEEELVYIDSKVPARTSARNPVLYMGFSTILFSGDGVAEAVMVLNNNYLVRTKHKGKMMNGLI